LVYILSNLCGAGQARNFFWCDAPSLPLPVLGNGEVDEPLFELEMQGGQSPFFYPVKGQFETIVVILIQKYTKITPPWLTA